MVEYSKEEQLIARTLLEKPKTVEQLREELGLSISRVNEALSKLIKLRVVERNEEHYKLISSVEKQLKGFQGEVKENFRVRMTIEAFSESKEALEKQLEILENRMKAEKIKIIDFFKAMPDKQESNYSSYIDVEFYATSIHDVLGVIINFGPSCVELIEPKEMTLNMKETQDLMNEVMSAVHYYISLILSLKYKELAEKGKKTTNLDD